MRRPLKAVLVLLMTGTFVSATQASLAGTPAPAAAGTRKNCFEDGGLLDLAEMRLGAPAASMAAADTLETYEVELEDEGKKGVNVKAIIGFTIAAAFIGYALYILLVPEEEEEEEQPAGKEPPVYLRIPF
jgi:hypothetical protein